MRWIHTRKLWFYSYALLAIMVLSSWAMRRIHRDRADELFELTADQMVYAEVPVATQEAIRDVFENLRDTTLDLDSSNTFMTFFLIAFWFVGLFSPPHGAEERHRLGGR